MLIAQDRLQREHNYIMATLQLLLEIHCPYYYYQELVISLITLQRILNLMYNYYGECLPIDFLFNAYCVQFSNLRLGGDLRYCLGGER